MLVLRKGPDWGGGWVWPVPDNGASVPLSDGLAVISQRFSAPRHMGVDIMYRGRDQGFHAPVGTPVIAAKSGKVWSFGHTARGFNVVVDHGPPFATFYQHLETLEPWVAKGATVSAGSQLGRMGADPTDPERIRHLHFEVWWQGPAANAVDPAPMLAGARRMLWTP